MTTETIFDATKRQCVHSGCVSYFVLSNGTVFEEPLKDCQSRLKQACCTQNFLANHLSSYWLIFMFSLINDLLQCQYRTSQREAGREVAACCHRSMRTETGPMQTSVKRWQAARPQVMEETASRKKKWSSTGSIERLVRWDVSLTSQCSDVINTWFILLFQITKAIVTGKTLITQSPKWCMVVTIGFSKLHIIKWIVIFDQ